MKEEDYNSYVVGDASSDGNGSGDGSGEGYSEGCGYSRGFGSVANWLTYKQLYEDSQNQKEAIIKEKNELYDLAYNKNMFGSDIPYKDLYKEQQKLANNLTQKVNKLQSEIDNIKGFKTYVLESGEEVKAEKIRTNGGWIEFIKDGEVFKTVELQEWEIK